MQVNIYHVLEALVQDYRLFPRACSSYCSLNLLYVHIRGAAELGVLLN